jgi:hypothetical protein
MVAETFIAAEIFHAYSVIYFRHDKGFRDSGIDLGPRLRADGRIAGYALPRPDDAYAWQTRLTTGLRADPEIRIDHTP